MVQGMRERVFRRVRRENLFPAGEVEHHQGEERSVPDDSFCPVSLAHESEDING
jgi:hypothetical protein